MNVYDATEQAYKNGYEAGKPKWISVKKDLPKKNGRYLVRKVIGVTADKGLVWYDVLDFAKDGRKVNKYDFHDDWKNVWYEYDSEWGYCVWDSVTHWMEIPEDPKGE